MNDVGAQIQVATLSMAQRNQKLQGQEALMLIQAAAGQTLASPPPPPSQPVAVTPRAGSTIEIVA